MDLFDVLYVRRKGKPLSTAELDDNILGLKLHERDYGGEEKTIDFAPIISVSDALAKPAIDLQCKITAVQEGSGDPSPQNIRPITGFTGLTLHVNSSEIPVTWQTEAGTVYGGVVDLTTGLLSVDRRIVSGSDWNTAQITKNTSSESNYVYFFRKSDCDYTKNAICSHAPVMSSVPQSTYGIRTSSAQSAIFINFLDLIGTNDVSHFKQFCIDNGVQMVYYLSEPIEYDITPQTVALLAGNNTLWNTAGDTALKYMAKKS